MDAASYFHSERVQRPLGLAHAAPPAGALRLAGPRGARAGPAPDAGEALVEERVVGDRFLADVAPHVRSEEHTSELQSRRDLVCRLLLEKKKKKQNPHPHKNQKKTKNKISTN